MNVAFVKPLYTATGGPPAFGLPVVVVLVAVWLLAFAAIDPDLVRR